MHHQLQLSSGCNELHQYNETHLDMGSPNSRPDTVKKKTSYIGRMLHNHLALYLRILRKKEKEL